MTTRPHPRLQSLRATTELARISFLQQLQYRANFWVYVINAIVELTMTLLTLSIVYGHVDEIDGWTRDGLLVVVGSFFILHTIVQGVVHPSVARLVESIRTGNFDHRLLKPVDAQLVSLVQNVDGWRITSLVLGVGLTAGALVHGDITPTAAQFGSWLGMVLCGVVIAGAYWSLISSITFWTVQGEGILWTLDDLYEYVRWPITIFPGAIRIILSTVFPFGLAVTVPAQAILGTLTWKSALAAVVVAFGCAVGARVLWLRAVRRYEGASG